MIAGSATTSCIEEATRAERRRRSRLEADQLIAEFHADQRSLAEAFDQVFDEYGGWFDIEGVAHPVRAVPWQWVLDTFVIWNGGEAHRDALERRAASVAAFRYRVDYILAGNNEPWLYVWRKNVRFARSMQLSKVAR